MEDNQTSDPSVQDRGRNGESSTPRQLPADLPTSLDDRRPAIFHPAVEVYDAWQGQSQFLTTPGPARALDFNLSLDEPDDDSSYLPPKPSGNDYRFDQMLVAQAAHREDGALADDNKVAADELLSESEKKQALQKALNTAASNGDLAKLKSLLSGPAQAFIDINMADEEGTAPLIYASCFGHEDVVLALLEANADVDRQDRNAWTSLMWATANRHGSIVQTLLDHGASPKAKSSSGRTAFDFAAPDSDIAEYLHENGYKIGSAGVAGDFYSSGLSQDRFEEEIAENEMKRRMMMESAMNLEVDLGNLGYDEQSEPAWQNGRWRADLSQTPEEHEDEPEFVWDKCLNDQMFVFQEAELDRLLDAVITNMAPQRSSSQKPVPANVIFLSARYAHYHAHADLLERLLVTAAEKMNDVVEKMQWDMTILAFWMSNATLLLHYLKKDTGLISATTEFQVQLAELINEIFVLIIRDAERRMDKVLDVAMLDHETIPGFEGVQFQNEWNLFRSRTKAKAPESIEKRFRPPSPKRRAKVSPRNITSLLSSTLFVLDLYDIHSVISSQVFAQLLYWLGAELFNRIMSNRKYLARTKAMQVRMNVSVLEDWALNNNRHSEHYENGSTSTMGEATVDAARHHLALVIQLLQWLQVCTSLDGSPDSLRVTIEQLPRLSPQQLLHAVKYYRAEVGEKTLPKPAMKFLVELQKEATARKAKKRLSMVPTSPATPTLVISGNNIPDNGNLPSTPGTRQNSVTGPEDDDVPDHLLLDPALMLPFSLPTSTDMLISYGAGLGGLNKDRAKKYIPTVPPEILAKLDMAGRKESNLYDNESWNYEEE